MDISIRQAAPEDAAAIAEMHIASWHAAYTGIVSQAWLDSRNLDESSERWKNNLSGPADQKQITFLAFKGDFLVGFATAGQSRSEAYSDYAELWAIYVRPQYFGKGVGRVLFNRCAAYVQEIDYKNMFVNVLFDNDLARKFYERIGASVIEGSNGTVELGDQKYNDIKYEWKELGR